MSSNKRYHIIGADLDPNDEFAVFRKWEKEALEQIQKEDEEEAKKQSSYGQDSKGRYVILNGKRCYTKEDVEEEFKNLTFE